MIRRAANDSVPDALVASFGTLKHSIRRLRRLLFLLLGAVTVLPAAIFFLFEMFHSQERTQLQAQALAHLASLHAEFQDSNGAGLSSCQAGLAACIQKEMEHYKLLFVQVLTASGKEFLRLGAPGRQIIPLTAEAPFPHAMPWSIVIQRDIRPLFVETGRVLGIHLIVVTGLALFMRTVPIRALRRTMQNLQVTQAQVFQAAKLSAIGEAYANLAHEINNPVSILVGRVQLLLESSRKQSLPPDVLHDLEVIERHGHRIANIFQALLVFAHKTPLELLPTDLNQVIQESIALVQETFANQGIQIQTDLALELPACVGSPNRLQQVFVNLFNNARDAMPQGGWIRVRTYSDKQGVVAEVHDTGTGIAEEIHDRIFEPFFTTKKAGKGTGLGLAVSSRMIADCGGEIEAESLPGKGAKFRLKLPLEA